MRAVLQVVALMMLAAPVAAGAGATAGKITYEPLAPTARDPIQVQVSGTAPTPCIEPALAARVEGRILRLDLDLGRCATQPPPAGATVFAARTRIEPLPAGRYAVQVFEDGVLQESDVLEVAGAESAAGMPSFSGLGTLAVILLLALAGSALLR